MNGVEFYTKAVDIIVKLDGYDYKDFDVVIQTDTNRPRVTTVTPHDAAIANLGDNIYKVGYIGLNYFSLDSLKITCKYPVVVKCGDFIISKYIEPGTEKTKYSLMNGVGDWIELEGTEKQIEAFEAERKEKNDALFPRHMSFIKTIELALEHGLTVKKVTTRK